MMMHDGLGGFGFFWLLVYILLLVVPVAKILGRMGFSQLWAIVALIPLVNLILLWVLAFVEWPRDRAAGGAGQG